MGDWRKGKTILECHKFMLDNELETDIIFVVGPIKQRIKAHKFMLMSRSSVFHQELAGGQMLECVINDVDPHSFRNMLRYIYYDHFEGDLSTALKLYKTANKYCLEELANRCLDFLKSHLSVDSVCAVLQYAYRINEEATKRNAREYFLKFPQVLLASEEFTDLPEACVIDLLQTYRLNVPEERIYEAVVRWSKKECRRQDLEETPLNQQSVAKEIMKMINFLKMDSNYFNEKVSTEQIVEQHLLIDVFRKFLQQSQSRREPQIPQQSELQQQQLEPQVQQVMQPGANAPSQATAVAGGDNSGGQLPGTESQSGSSTGNVACYVRSAAAASPGVKALPPRSQQVPSGASASSVGRELVRFQGVSSGKGYLNNKEDAICFMSDSNLSMLEIWVYGSQQREGRYEISLEILEENRRIVKTIKEQLTTNGRQKMYPLKINPSISIKNNVVYTIKMRMRGPTSFYGVNGQNVVTCTLGDSDVTVTFLPLEDALNGTNTERGQFPKFMFMRC